MRGSSLAILPCRLQVRSEALNINDQWLCDFRMQTTTIDPVSQPFLAKVASNTIRRLTTRQPRAMQSNDRGEHQLAGFRSEWWPE